MKLSFISTGGGLILLGLFELYITYTQELGNYMLSVGITFLTMGLVYFAPSLLGVFSSSISAFTITLIEVTRFTFPWLAYAIEPYSLLTSVICILGVMFGATVSRMKTRCYVALPLAIYAIQGLCYALTRVTRQATLILLHIPIILFFILGAVEVTVDDPRTQRFLSQLNFGLMIIFLPIEYSFVY